MPWWRWRRAVGRWLRRRGWLAATGTPQITRLVYRHGRPHDARMAWDHDDGL